MITFKMLNMVPKQNLEYALHFKLLNQKTIGHTS